MSKESTLNSKKIYLVAGEASGDLHGSNLMKALEKLNSSYTYRYYGGDLMQSVDGELVSHYKNRAVMGIIEVVKSLKKFKKWIQECKDDIEAFQPDVLVLIDYGGFNLRIAEFAHKLGIPVHYYIPPKVWAWNEKRVYKIRKYTDKVYVILPFEKKYYTRHGVTAEYVGNPIADEIAASGILNSEHERAGIALLPGSRKQEIRTGLPTMLAYARMKSEETFKLAAADSVWDLINSYSIPSNVELVRNDTYAVLRSSVAAVVTSGTANLEAALLNTPQVVVYRTGLLTFILGKLFIKVKHLSPVNLFAGKDGVKELLRYR
jgi:lipid-A-disaccharide synthase